MYKAENAFIKMAALLIQLLEPISFCGMGVQMLG